MNVLNIEHVSKIFGDKKIFDDISYGIHDGDKIGIIGINGTGKSTLLKIIAGEEETDEGQVISQNGLRITYLPQMPDFPKGAIVQDYVADGTWQKDWSTESEARNILNKLGITEHDVPVEQLSGGQKKRVALARTLVNPSDVLILDECCLDVRLLFLSIVGQFTNLPYRNILNFGIFDLCTAAGDIGKLSRCKFIAILKLRIQRNACNIHSVCSSVLGCPCLYFF